ncbi:MAG: hypothetical protein KF904_20265 [Rhodoblastus sp.]|nr:hypothetical protein [Rhodoblastus sp.]MCC0004655.1 hypothetical protein [Methylobacteriaceae bacterium]
MTFGLIPSLRPARHRPTETPWGPSQSADQIAAGVVSYSTSSHGGIHLDAAHNAQVHEAWRTAEGWYEEDVAWGIVAVTFPDLFPQPQVERAHASLMSYMPGQYEAATGKPVPPGASHVREDALFLKRNADRFIVRSAIYSKQRPGFIEVVATLGGNPTGREKRFLVPSAEYDNRSRHFVIDEDQHECCDGKPSSFAGYSVRA